MRYLMILTFAMTFAGCASVQNETTPVVVSKNAVLPEAPQSIPMIDWPVDSARLTQRFNLARRRPHLGIDLAAPRNTPILASHHGTVIYAGHGFHGYGRMIIIEQDRTLATLYSHLQKILVHEGDFIKQGQVVGLMGSTGNAHGVHLHFEVRRYLEPVDPLDWLPTVSRLAATISNRSTL